MTLLHNFLRRFRRSEDGSATVEFAILVMPLFVMLCSAAELGLIHVRQSMLESAMDRTVRDIRLGTGNAPQHDAIKAAICSRAGFIDDCDSIRLEMIQLDPRAWTAVPPAPDCVDRSEEVAPVRNFENGRQNELMFLRACVKYDPILPTIGMGSNLIKDGAGQYALITTAAFVQEPR